MSLEKPLKNTSQTTLKSNIFWQINLPSCLIPRLKDGGLRLPAQFCHLDTACLEKFLELFSQAYSNEIHIIQLDNGRAHLALDLSIPDNIILLFQPPYCEGLSPESNSGACKPRPEVNPIERFWQEVKKFLKNKVFDSLDFLRRKLSNILAEFTPVDIASITGFDFILDALSVAGL
jgi:putative transposase